MGLAYKLFQHLAIEAMEWGRDIGKEVDKERHRELMNKRYKDAREIINYRELDRHWENRLQDAWDNAPSAFGKKIRRHSE